MSEFPNQVDIVLSDEVRYQSVFKFFAAINEQIEAVISGIKFELDESDHSDGKKLLIILKAVACSRENYLKRISAYLGEACRGVRMDEYSLVFRSIDLLAERYIPALAEMQRMEDKLNKKLDKLPSDNTHMRVFRVLDDE